MAKALVDGMDWSRPSRRSAGSVMAFPLNEADPTASRGRGGGREEAPPQAFRTSREAPSRAYRGQQRRCAGLVGEDPFGMLAGACRSCSCVGTPELSSSPRGEAIIIIAGRKR